MKGYIADAIAGFREDLMRDPENVDIDRALAESSGAPTYDWDCIKAAEEEGDLWDTVPVGYTSSPMELLRYNIAARIQTALEEDAEDFTRELEDAREEVDELLERLPPHPTPDQIEEMMPTDALERRLFEIAVKNLPLDKEQGLV